MTQEGDRKGGTCDQLMRPLTGTAEARRCVPLCLRSWESYVPVVAFLVTLWRSWRSLLAPPFFMFFALFSVVFRAVPVVLNSSAVPLVLPLWRSRDVLGSERRS